MNVCFVDILNLQFLMNILINTILLEVDHLHVYFGTHDTRVRYDCWHIWVREGRWCLRHNVWFTAITVGLLKVPIQILHRPGELVHVSWPNVEYITFQVTVPTLEVGLGFRPWTLVFGMILLTSVLIGFG